MATHTNGNGVLIRGIVLAAVVALIGIVTATGGWAIRKIDAIEAKNIKQDSLLIVFGTALDSGWRENADAHRAIRKGLAELAKRQTLVLETIGVPKWKWQPHPVDTMVLDSD